MFEKLSKIDTHQHLMYPAEFSYPWAADFEPLNKPFLLEAYQTAADGCAVEGTLFMEVDVDETQSGDEARKFCTWAESPETGIRGVIASGRPELEGFDAYLDSIQHPKLKGIRRVLHTQPDELITNHKLQKNVGRLGERGLPFDLCVLQRQLPLALGLVQECPGTQFILDHCGNPEMTEESRSGWESGLRELAAMSNLVCKISGIPASVPRKELSTDVLRPYVETVVDVFGWDRVIWGGDWPVCTLSSSLKGWVSILDEIFLHEQEQNIQKLCSENAERVYGLSLVSG